MKTMKSLGLGRRINSITNRGSSGGSRDQSPAPDGDSPDAVAARAVKQFCESGGPGSTGDEVTFLPTIVEAAESSPAAASECARLIRKYLQKDYFSKPSYQYNAIMLLRILSDNPGPTFTRNIDKKFSDAAKDLLRNGRELNVKQMLMETLDSFEHNKQYDEGVKEIVSMWKKEKDKAYKVYGGQAPPVSRNFNAPEQAPNQNYFARNHRSRHLPDAVELAHRLEEARTSAKLLEQTVACTAPGEFLQNELIREFADRCHSASRSVQGYMAAENPGPDNDTMESLIDTNEQLQQALNQHQRAMLNARKQAGLGESRSNEPSPSPNMNGPSQPPPAMRFGAQWANPEASSSRDQLNQQLPPLPSRAPLDKGKGKAVAASRLDGPSGLNGSSAKTPDQEDPFADPPTEPPPSHNGREEGMGAPAKSSEEPRLAFEPYHPGFSSTPSYLDRQDSATAKVAMHGAASPPTDATSAPPPGRLQPQAYDDDDEDLYDHGGSGGSSSKK